MTISADPVAAYAAGAPERVAVIEGDAVTTYAELNAEVNRLANGLRALGVQPGERLIWCAPNSREVLVVMHTCRKLGLAQPYTLDALTDASTRCICSRCAVWPCVWPITDALLLCPQAQVARLGRTAKNPCC